MKATLLIFTFLSFSTIKNNCEKLKDGIYLVKHTSNNGAVDYKLAIKGERCNIRINDTIEVEGRVTWINDCSLKFDSNNPKRQDTSEIGKKLFKSFGEPFIEIKATKGKKNLFQNNLDRQLAYYNQRRIFS